MIKNLISMLKIYLQLQKKILLTKSTKKKYKFIKILYYFNYIKDFRWISLNNKSFLLIFLPKTNNINNIILFKENIFLKKNFYLKKQYLNTNFFINTSIGLISLQKAYKNNIGGILLLQIY